MTFQDQMAQLQQQQAQLQAQQAQAAKDRQRQLMTYSDAHNKAVAAAQSAPAEIRVPLQSALSDLHSAIHSNEGAADRASRSFQHVPPQQRAALQQQAVDASRQQVQDALQQAKDRVQGFKASMIKSAGTIDPGDASEAALIDKKNDVREALNAGAQPETLLHDALVRGDDLTAHVLTGEPGRMMLQSRGVYQGPLHAQAASYRIGQQAPGQYLAPVSADSAVRLALSDDLDNVLSQAQALSQ